MRSRLAAPVGRSVLKRLWRRRLNRILRATLTSKITTVGMGHPLRSQSRIATLVAIAGKDLYHRGHRGTQGEPTQGTSSPAILIGSPQENFSCLRTYEAARRSSSEW